jgi:ribonuclease HII
MLLGVDEAGRSPLAGPVAVGTVAVSEGFDVAREFPDAKDSKLLSPQKREEIYVALRARELHGDLRFCVRFSDHAYIDEFGITRAVRRAIKNGIRTLAPRAEGVHVLLDGLLYAPRAYSQETVIHGDLLVPLISLASIVAKVRRDRLMRFMARTYPQYGFEVHKGYGTRAHRAAIKANGLCEIHRRTYCKSATGQPSQVVVP